MPAAVKPTYPASVPPWLQAILNDISLSPASTSIVSEGGPVLKSIGRELSELLGTVFETNPGRAKAAGVPVQIVEPAP